jgi:hypothetical protein
VTVAITLWTGAPAAAQSTSNTVAFEVTPWMSFGSYPSSRYGVGILFPLTMRLNMEAEVGLRPSLFNELSATMSIVSPLPRIGRVTPYFAGGAGIEQYVFGSTLMGLPISEKRTVFAANVGGGLKVPVDDKWSIRADARFVTGYDAAEHWRFYSGVSLNVGR